jgi:hypothetical protein
LACERKRLQTTFGLQNAKESLTSFSANFKIFVENVKRKKVAYFLNKCNYKQTLSKVMKIRGKNQKCQFVKVLERHQTMCDKLSLWLIGRTK